MGLCEHYAAVDNRDYCERGAREEIVCLRPIDVDVRRPAAAIGDLATKQTHAATRQSEQSARDLNQLGDRLSDLIARNDHVE